LQEKEIWEAAMTLGPVWTATALMALLAQGQDPHAHHRAAPAPEAGGWVKYRHKTAGFSLEHPADWRVDRPKGGVSVHIAHPTKPVHLFASAFTMAAGTLQDFAAQKFGVQPETFRPLGPARAMEGVGWSGLVQDAEATQGEEHARRRILCAKHGDLYVSLALYADPKELAVPDANYERLFTSLRFDAGPASPTSSPAQPY
jgi:hypothetical protein